MTTPFQDAAVLASSAVDEVFGESLRITPMKSGRYQDDVADPDRSVINVVGAFYDGPERMKILSRGLAGRDFDKRVAVRVTYITIDNDFVAGCDIRKGDKVTRLDLPGTPQFEIALPEPDGVQRLKLNLVSATA
jgi:hypothetical protein